MAELPPFNVKFNFKGGSKARNAAGQFRSVTYDELTNLAARLARQVQADAVTNLQGSYVRPDVRTNRLVRVTADSRNIHYDRLGFAVGLDSFLDRSEALYWRTIEEGSAATWRRGGMIGMKIFGRWVDAGGSPVARGGRLDSIGTGGGGSLRSRGLKLYVVKHEIQPHRYYARAWQEARPELTYEREAARILNKAVRTQISIFGA